MHAELLDEFEQREARHLVALRMRLAGLQGVHTRMGCRCRGRLLHELHQNLVGGEFMRDTPDRVWVADVTQH